MSYLKSNGDARSLCSGFSNWLSAEDLQCAEANGFGGSSGISSWAEGSGGPGGSSADTAGQARPVSSRVASGAEGFYRRGCEHAALVEDRRRTRVPGEKKSLHATERDTEANQLRRKVFVDRLRTITADRLVFLDESGVSTQMTRRYGRARRGVRVSESTPEGNWKILTILGAMSVSGMIATMTGELERAAQVLSALIALTPANVQAHLNLGLVDAQRKQYAEAAKEFGEVLRVDTSNIDSYNDVARVSCLKCLINLQEFSRALPASREYRRKAPNNFDALELGGEIERGAGNYAEAELLLTRAVAMDPTHYNARYFLGLLLASQGKNKEARVQFEEALRLNPDSSEARFQLSKVLRVLGLGDEAREQMAILERKKASAVHEDIAASKANEASQRFNAGNSAQAVSLYRESIAEYGGNARTYYDLSLALRAEKNGREQRLMLNKAVQLDHDFAPAHNQLALLDMEADQSGKAEAELKTAISLDPQYAEAQNNLGVLYGRLGRNEEAERLFRKSVEDDDRYADAALNLGLMLAAQARFSEAEKALRRAIDLSPENGTARSMVSERLKQ